MLSILIPVYNFDIRNLVNDLNNQCTHLNIPFEIVCLDDGSQRKYKVKNREIISLEMVVYEELSQNLGRSKIRNELGKRASFEYLIFMDCDSKVVSKNYIKNYIEYIKPVDNNNTAPVFDKLLYGGRCYSPFPPQNQDHLFHWTFGIHREQSSAKKRLEKPYHSFMTNNFFIPKKIFLEIPFDESLTQYGHEDTLFGMELRSNNISIVHIDNPLEHIGLEETEVFLGKSKKAIENLKVLYEKESGIETKLLNVFSSLRKFKFTWLFGKVFNIIEPLLIRNFRSKKPNLKQFDFYKLGYLCSLFHHKID